MLHLLVMLMPQLPITCKRTMHLFIEFYDLYKKFKEVTSKLPLCGTVYAFNWINWSVFKIEMEISKNYAYFGCLWQTIKLAIYVYAYLNLMIHNFLWFFTGIYLVCLHFSDFNESFIHIILKFQCNFHFCYETQNFIKVFI